MRKIMISIILGNLILGILSAVNSEPIVIAHRGNSKAAPENTLAAFRSALALNPQPAYVELDIHRSLDGVLVVSHDDNTQRTTGIASLIRERPFAELRKLHAGYSAVFGDTYKSEMLPRLEEVLDLVRDTPVNVMIECKQLLVEDAVTALLKKRNELSRHIIAGFSELTLYRTKQLEPSVKTLYLMERFDSTSLWHARDIAADIIAVNKQADPQIVKAAHAAGLPIWIWTVDEAKDIRIWKEAGVEGIITNLPALALQIVHSQS